MSSQTILEAPTARTEYDADKEAARDIQHSLVPAGNLKIPGAEVAYRFSPFAEVGGDFLDFFCLPDGMVGIYIGDVVGKGLSAAMYGALVMGALRGINKTGEDTAAVLALLNIRWENCGAVARASRLTNRSNTFSRAPDRSQAARGSTTTSPPSRSGCRWKPRAACVRSARLRFGATISKRSRNCPFARRFRRRP